MNRNKLSYFGKIQFFIILIFILSMFSSISYLWSPWSYKMNPRSHIGDQVLFKSDYYGYGNEIIMIEDPDADVTPGPFNDIIIVFINSSSDPAGLFVTGDEFDPGVFVVTIGFTDGPTVGTFLHVEDGDLIMVIYKGEVYASDIWHKTYTAIIPKPPMEDEYHGLSSYHVLKILDPDMDITNITETFIPDNLTAKIDSTSDPIGITATFIELFPTDGEFYFVFSFTNGSTYDDYLHVEDGDTISLTYYDEHNYQGDSVYLEANATWHKTYTGTINVSVTGSVSAGLDAVAEVTINDKDLDINPLVLDNYSLPFSPLEVHTQGNSSNLIKIPLNETGPSTGIFKGVFNLTLGPTNQDIPSLHVYDGAIIIYTYYDARDMYGDSVNLSKQEQFFLHQNGVFIIDDLEYFGDPVTVNVTIKDKDLNQLPTVQETATINASSSPSDLISITIYENGTNSDKFIGQFDIGSLVTSDPDDYLHANTGENITIIYFDEKDINGTSQTRIVNITWYEFPEPPSIKVVGLVNNSIIWSGTLLNFNVSDNWLIDSIWYRVNFGPNITIDTSIGVHNFSFVINATIEDPYWIYGLNYIDIFANDSLGFETMSRFILTLDDTLIRIRPLNQTNIVPDADGNILIEWNSSPAWNPISFDIYRSTTLGFTPNATNQIAQGISDIYYLDNGTVDGLHYYTIIGFNGTNNSTYWEYSSILIIDITPPSWVLPPTFTSTPVGTENARLAWTNSFDSYDIAGFSIYRANVDNFTQSVRIANLTELTYLDTSLNATIYYYWITAYDEKGQESGPSFSRSVILPGFDDGDISCNKGEYFGDGVIVYVNITDLDLNQNDLTIQNVTVTANTSTYSINFTCLELGPNSDTFVGNFSLVTTGTNDSTDELNITPGSTITIFYLDEKNSAGYPIYRSVTIFWIDDPQPPIIELDAPANSSIVWSWDTLYFTVRDNVRVDSVWYRVNDGINVTVATDIQFDEYSFGILVNLSAPDWIYGFNYIDIFANDTMGMENTSRFSFIIDDTLIRIRPLNLTNIEPDADGNILIEWNSSPAWNPISFDIYRSTIPGFIPNATNRIAQAIPWSTNYYIDNGTDDGLHYYTIIGFNGTHNSTCWEYGSILVNDITPPIPPQDINATPVGTSGVRLIWTAPPAYYDVVGYSIYRATIDDFAQSVWIANVTELTHLDTGLSSGLYFYWITAYDEKGQESGPSSPEFVILPGPEDGHIETDRAGYFGENVTVYVTITDLDLNQDDLSVQDVTINVSTGFELIYVNLFESGCNNNTFFGNFTLVTYITNDTLDYINVTDGAIITISYLDETNSLDIPELFHINITWNLISQAPIINLISPENETTVQKPNLIDLNIYDPNLDLSTVEWRANTTQLTWTNSFIGSYDIDLSSFASDQTVQFWVRANDTADNQNLITFVLTFDDIPPTKPSNMTAVIQKGNITISWNTSSDVHIVYYHIWRHSKKESKYLGNITSTFYTDLESLKPGKYTYEIIPFDEANNTGESITITVKIRGKETYYPFLEPLDNQVTIIIIAILGSIAMVIGIAVLLMRKKFISAKNHSK